MVGDFEGALLVKKYRPAGPYDEEAERELDEAEKCLAGAGYKDKDSLEWMMKNYGKKNGEKLYWIGQASCQVGSSWECRDCAVLDEREYFKKLREWHAKLS